MQSVGIVGLTLADSCTADPCYWRILDGLCSRFFAAALQTRQNEFLSESFTVRNGKGMIRVQL